MTRANPSLDDAPTDHQTLGPLLATVENTARALGVSKSSVWRLIKHKHLDTTKIGGRTLITTASVRRIAERGTQ